MWGGREDSLRASDRMGVGSTNLIQRINFKNTDVSPIITGEISMHYRDMASMFLGKELEVIH